MHLIFTEQSVRIRHSVRSIPSDVDTGLDVCVSPALAASQALEQPAADPRDPLLDFAEKALDSVALPFLPGSFAVFHRLRDALDSGDLLQ